MKGVETFKRNQGLSRMTLISAVASLATILVPATTMCAASSTKAGDPTPDRTASISEPEWGEPVEGVSVRLQVEKTSWELPETPILKVSVRNQGGETLSVARTQQPGELEVDGVWYSWSKPYHVSLKPLAAGQQFEDIRITPSGQWRSGLNVFLTQPGQYKFRFAVVAQRAEPNRGPAIRAVSNPVEIEVHWSAESIQDTAGRNARSAQPSSAYFRGRVVDYETGQPITNFALQFGTSHPPLLENLTWAEGYSSPNTTGSAETAKAEGRFGGQISSTGKAWARILAEGYLPQPVTPEPVLSPARMENLIVRMKRDGAVRGRVLDHAGKPVAGARVYFVGIRRLYLTDGEPGHFDGSGGGRLFGASFKGGTATTDADGRFAVAGGDATGQKVVVAAGDGRMTGVAPIPGPGRELNLTLPRPGTLIVRYDIAEDAAQAQLLLHLVTGELDRAVWKNVSCTLAPKVANRNQITLNLTPGTYDFQRFKELRVGNAGHGANYELRTIVIEAGETQRVDLVRTAGFSIRGEVTGLKERDAPGAYIFVRSPEVTGDPVWVKEWSLPMFDAVGCGKDGLFQTARLDPGTYTIVAEAYNPETPEERYRSGLRLPAYVGTVKVTVSAKTAPAPVKIQLRPASRDGGSGR